MAAQDSFNAPVMISGRFQRRERNSPHLQRTGGAFAFFVESVGVQFLMLAVRCMHLLPQTAVSPTLPVATRFFVDVLNDLRPAPTSMTILPKRRTIPQTITLKQLALH